MADQKISALTGASTPLAGTEVLPIVQSGTTKKVAVSDLTAGRAVSTGVLTVTNGTNPYIAMPDGTGTAYIQVASGNLDFVPRSGKDVSVTGGNLVIGTAGKGIDFSADGNAAGMTSELLDDYEEGTWTPTLTPSTSGTITLGSPNLCAYTKIGRVVTVNGLVDTASVSSPVGASVTINNLPFASNATGSQRSACAARCFALTTGSLDTTMVIVSSATTMVLFADASLFQTGSQVYFQMSYTV